MDYSIREVKSNDREACLALFQKAFGEVVDPVFWDWKYSIGQNVSFIAIRNGEVVAHYGCVSRRILVFGKLKTAVQITDVMVHPSERAILAKKGAFYLVASTSQNNLIGSKPNEYIVGYGFPTERHMRLGARSGLYEEVERITELYWEPRTMANSMMTVAKEIKLEKHIGCIKFLWLQMKKDLRSSIVGDREVDYLISRYQENPRYDYHCILVARRWSQPLGLIVLRQDGEVCRLIDVVAPLHNLPFLVGYARKMAWCWGSKKLVAWITSNQAEHFGRSFVEKKISDICIPCNAYHQSIPCVEVRNRWWLMMGDTDFM